MRIYIDFNEDGDILSCGTTPINGSETYVNVDDWENFMNNVSSYRYKDGKLVFSKESQLKQAQMEKDEELNRACQNSILDGFYHEIDGETYKFSFDTEAQLNFQGVERLFSQGTISDVMWTVRKDGKYTRIKITKEIMDELTLKILWHKDSNISRYRDELMPLVASAKTLEELERIHWDMKIQQVQE